MSALVDAIIDAESGGDPHAVSPKGAAGLMQLMPDTARELGVTNRFDPKQNRDAGEKMIDQLMSKYGDLKTALIAYNWGQGNVDHKGIKAAPKESHAYANKVMHTLENAAPKESTKTSAKNNPSTPSIDDFLDAPVEKALSAPPKTAEKPTSVDAFLDAEDTAHSAEEYAAPANNAAGYPLTPAARKIDTLAHNAVVEEKKDKWSFPKGVGETALNVATGVGSTIAGGLLGGLRAAYSLSSGEGLDEASKKGAETVQKIQQAGTYQPRTAAGQLMTGLGGEVLQVPSKIGGEVGGVVGEAVDGPQGEIAGQSIGEVAPALIGGVSALKGAVGRIAARPNFVAPAIPRAAKLLQKAMDDMTPSELQEAKDLMSKAQAEGIALTGPEALATAPKLHKLLTDVDKSNPVIAKFVKERPDQARKAIQDKLQTVGQDVGLQAAANQAQTGATKAIQTAEAERSAAASPFYQAAKNDQVPAPAIESIISDVDAAIKADKTGIIAGKLTEFKNALIDTSGVAPSAITDIANLDRARKYFRDKIELPSMSADALPKEVASALNPFLARIKSEMEVASGNYQKGKSEYQNASKTRVDPLMKGPIGGVAGKGADAAKEATSTRLLSELQSNSATPDRVRTLASELTKEDPTAFPNAVRAHLEAKFDASMAEKIGPLDQLTGAKFADAVASTPKERAVLSTSIEEVAKAQGSNIRDARLAAKGFSDLLDVLRATGRVRGVGAQSTLEAGALEKGALAAPYAAAHTASYGALRALADATKHVINKKAYGDLAKVFTDPDAITLMEKLAKTAADNKTLRQQIATEILGRVIPQTAAIVGVAPATPTTAPVEEAPQ